MMATATIEVSECLIFDMIDNPGSGVVIWPEEIEAVKQMDIRIGHAPIRTDDGFRVTTADCFSAGRSECCWRESATDEWKIGNGE